MSILFNCQRSEARQTAGRDEPRAQEIGVRVYGALRECRRKGDIPEARAPKSIIQEGKKGLGGLAIVFMDLQAVTGVSGEISTRRKRRVSRYNCRNKVTGEMRVKAESLPIPAERV